MNYQGQLQQMKDEIMTYFVELLKSKKTHKIEVYKYNINCFIGDYEYQLRYISLLKGDMVRFMFVDDFGQDEWFDGKLDIDSLAQIADEIQSKYGDPTY